MNNEKSVPPHWLVWLHQTVIRGAYFFGERAGDWVAHRLGWHRFINESYVRQHADGCDANRPQHLTRVGGFVERCETCGATTRIKFSCWETEDGKMPMDVVRWVDEELRYIQENGSFTPPESQETT